MNDSVMQCDPAQPSAELPDPNICPQCQQPNHCDIANGLSSCWCFDVERRDVGSQSTRQENTTPSQCLCHRCLKLQPTRSTDQLK